MSGACATPSSAEDEGETVAAPGLVGGESSVFNRMRDGGEFESASGVVGVTSESFESAVLNSPTPVLVVVCSDGDSNCQLALSLVEAMAAEFGDGLKCVVVDGEEDRVLADAIGVSTTPSFVVMNEGEVNYQFVGVPSEENLRFELKKLIDFRGVLNR